jgi:hypothetical protein
LCERSDAASCAISGNTVVLVDEIFLVRIVVIAVIVAIAAFAAWVGAWQ